MIRVKIYFSLILLCLVQILYAQDIPFPNFEELDKQDAKIEPDSGNIALSIDLTDVVVTAQYAPTDSKNALQNIRTINRSIIEQQGATNLEQLLLQDLNVRVQQDLITGSSLRLLGVGGENVKIMMDGVPIIGRLDGNIDLGQINLNNIERLEIIEGPMSVMYGTDALGGVINLISKKSQIDTLQLQISQQIESRGENISLLDIGYRPKQNWLFRLNTGYDQFNGFSTDTLRNLPWNPKRQSYTNAGVHHSFKDDHFLRYQFSFLDEEVQDLGNKRRISFEPYAYDNFYLTRRLNHSLSHEGSIGENFYWQTVLGYNDFDRKVHNYRTNFNQNEHIFHESNSDTTRFELWMLRSVFASKFQDSRFNFQVGIDLNKEYASGQRIHDVNSPVPHQSNIADYAVFGTLRYRPSVPLTMELGLRAAQNSRYAAPIIPSFHLKYRLKEDWNFRASYAKGFRSPSLKELFLNFIDTNHFIVGNEDLKAETSDNFQANLSYRKRNNKRLWQGQLQAFYNNVNDQIQLFPFIEEDGMKVPHIESNHFAYFNIAEAKTLGATLRLSHHWRDWQVGAGLSQIGYYNPLSEDMDYVEGYTFATEWNGRLSYHFQGINTRAALFVRSNDRFISYVPDTENGVDIARQQIQDGFTLMDATLTQQLWHNRLTLTAGVRNILDVQQVNLTGGGGTSTNPHGGGNQLNVGVGRSFFVRAAYQFGGAKYEKPTRAAYRVHSLEEELYSTWIEENSQGATSLQYAKWKGKKWSRSKQMKHANSRWVTDGIDAPQLAKYPDGEALVTTWMLGSSRWNPYDQDIYIAQSMDGGDTWENPSTPYPNERLVSAFYGHCRLLPLSNDRMLALWLDGRNTKYKHQGNGRMMPKPGSKYELRSIEFDKSGRYYESTVLNDQIAGLCPFDITKTEDGVLSVYRDANNEISISKYKDGTWSPTKTLTNEHWRATNTLEAPATDALAKQVAIAWFTKPRNKAQVKIAFSDDNGETFTTPIRIDEGAALGKVDVLWQSEGKALVSWIEEKEDTTQLVVAQYDFYGNLLDKQYVALTYQATLPPPNLLLYAGEIGVNYQKHMSGDYRLDWLKFK